MVPQPKPEAPDNRDQRRARRLARRARVSVVGERAGWAELLTRVSGIDAFRCPRCAGPLTLRCLVVDPRAAGKILTGLEKATDPPPP